MYSNSKTLDSTYNFLHFHISFLATRQLIPKLDGVGRLFCYVQSSGFGATKCSTQIRTISPEQTNMYTPLCSRMHHCDYVLMRFVYVRISKGTQN